MPASAKAWTVRRSRSSSAPVAAADQFLRKQPELQRTQRVPGFEERLRAAFGPRGAPEHGQQQEDEKARTDRTINN